MWQRILTVIHEQVIMAPLSYLVNVAVLRDRFENFEFGHQVRRERTSCCPAGREHCRRCGTAKQ